MIQRSFVAGAIAFVASILPTFAADGLKPRTERIAADQFALTDAGGHAVTLSGLKGKVVLLDFWATWCTGCKEEMPWFTEFQTKYGRTGLAAVGVALDEDGWASVRPYVAAHPINYPIAIANEAFAAKYGFHGALPVTILIDRYGRIAEIHQGKVDKARFESDILQLLQESGK